MKSIKKLIALVLVLAMTAACFTGCGSSSSANGNTKHYKIGVALYTDSGKGVEQIKAFCTGISDAVNVEFVYTTLSTYDEATNLTAIQNLISSGCNGIIMTADMGTTSIVEECASAKVYLAGYLCSYNTSYNTAYDEVFGNEYFLGTVCDGHADGSYYAEDVAAKVIENGYKNIGVVIFPDYAYPNQGVMADAFRAKIDEYNATADAADQITVYDNEVLNFSPLEDTYFSNYPDMDCLFSIAAGAGMVYPTMVACNKTDIKLYTTGFEATDDADNFGTSGNQCFQGTLCSTAEAIVYPLCLIIDKLNGKTYSDLPAAERVDCSSLEILSDEDMAKVKSSSIYYSGNYENAFLTGEDVVNLCASYNESATYANLIDTIQHMGVEDLK